VYAVGDTGTIVHYDGTTWSVVMSGTTASLRNVWGTSENNIYAVGTGGAILRYDGTRWSEMPSGTTEDLIAVGGKSETDVFAVSAIGSVLRYNGTSWSRLASEPDAALPVRDAWGTSSTNIYALKSSSIGDLASTIYHFNGTAWTIVHRGPGSQWTSSFYQAVWGVSADEVYVVGTHAETERSFSATQSRYGVVVRGTR
jgi:hypothetical protein